MKKDKYKLRDKKNLKKYSKVAKFNSTLVENMHTLSSMNNYYSWLADVIRPFIGKRILDVGCANGNLTQFFLDREEIVGLDISQEYLDIINNRFKGQPNFKTQIADAANSKQMAQFKRGKFDTAITMNVLEHIEDDEAAMKNVFDVLEPGANFSIIVPAMNWMYAILDYEGGHFRRYSKKELIFKLKKAGFTIRSARYINFPGAVGWYVNYTLMKKRLFGKGTFGLYNKLVPLFRFCESIVKLPFGMSVIVTAQKPLSKTLS